MTTRKSVLLALSFCLTAGPAFAQKRLDEIVARVNAEIILKSELEESRTQVRRELQQAVEQGQVQAAQVETMVADREKHLLRDLIDNSLLMQMAKEMGLSADLEVVRTMERMRQEFKFASLEELEKAIVEQGSSVEDFKQNIRTRYLSQQVISREVYPKIVITTEEVRKFYEENKTEFDRPAGIRLREVAVYTENKTGPELEASRKKINDALEALTKGDDFGEVAQRFSESQTAESGGDMGFFAKGEIREELEKAANALEKGQNSGILELPFGFVIVRLEDKHAGGVLSFDLAQTDIQNRLWQNRVQPKIREYLTRLRSEGFVEVREGFIDSSPAPKIEKAASKDKDKSSGK